MTDRYVLEGRTPKPEPRLDDWQLWLATADRVIAEDQIGASRILTTFTGVAPDLFQTEIIGGPRNGRVFTCDNWIDAEAMHSRAVMMAKMIRH